MNAFAAHSPAWSKALTLTERAVALAAGPAPDPGAGANPAAATRKMERWRSVTPALAGDGFARRLAADGLTEDDLRRILGEPADRWARPDQVPAWLEQFASTFPVGSGSRTPPEAEPAEGDVEAVLLAVAEPLVRAGRDRLEAGVRALARGRPDLPFDPATAGKMLSDSLTGLLGVMLTRTLVLELNVARLQGVLAGDTPAERFRNFGRRLRDPEHALALWEEYPVLARQAAAGTDRWVAAGLEFLGRLAADWPALRRSVFAGADPGPLADVWGNAGDTHRGGRSVLIAGFASGARVVYKPRSLALDGHFQELLAWVNGRGGHPPFRTLTVLDRGTHGWMEYVTPEPCSSAAEVGRFYERLGGYLALLYALEATDFHSENIRAAGEHPVLLDLEALFHPNVATFDPRDPGQAANARLAYSVLKVGLLPQRIWETADSVGVDLSGLGAEAGQLTPTGVPRWEGEGTDEMRLVRKRVPIPGQDNRPTLNGAAVNPLDHADAIAAGFTDLYRLLLDHREELLAEGGPLARFADDEVRVIVRPTQTYSALLHESFHPDLCRDALDRDRHFDLLWAWVGARPELARLIPAEREDLRAGDIPLFTTRAGARDLWDSRGRGVPDFFDRPGLALVRDRLRRLDGPDLDRQLWITRASLTTLVMGGDRAPMPTYRPRPAPPADPAGLMEAARAVGDRLADLALRGAGGVSWVGVRLARERDWSLAPLGPDLYDGQAGVALFLAYLGRVTGRDEYTALAREAAASWRRQAEQYGPFLRMVGAFDGWGGVIYTLTHLGVLWQDPELLAEAERVAGRLPELIEKDEVLDVIGGAAGCICALAVLHAAAPSDRTLAAARQCGDRLLTRARAVNGGAGWETPIPARGPLTGFSHGAAGMALALFRLGGLTGDERYLRGGRAAVAYEQSVFRPDARNWPDLRVPADEQSAAADPPCAAAWCHGAPGIALARLHALGHMDDPETRAEIRTALETTLAVGFATGHCLCHGDLGNLDALVEAHAVLGEPRWRAAADRLAGVVLESSRRDGWLCGVPLGVESPGLMTGLAGIGYELLRLAAPGRVPSVLALAPPVAG